MVFLSNGDWLVAFGAFLSGAGGFLVGMAALRMAANRKNPQPPTIPVVKNEAAIEARTDDDRGT